MKDRKFMAVLPLTQVIPFVLAYSGIFIFIFYLLRNKIIFGKKISEYLWPIRFYIPLAIVGVAWQYVGPFGNAGNVGQLLWTAATILSAATLARNPDFNFKNILLAGVFYSLLIHGSKILVRYFIYGPIDPIYRTFDYLSGRFVYGSVLVMSYTVLGALAYRLLEESRKKKLDNRKIILNILGVVLTVIFLLVSMRLYNPSVGI